MSLIKEGIIASEQIAIGKVKLMKNRKLRLIPKKFLMMK